MVSIANNPSHLFIVAQNLADLTDYFEIKVNGVNEVENVLRKFESNLGTISRSLRIMNDVMVLLNPRMLSTAPNAAQ